jgi:hypothetical protein
MDHHSITPLLQEVGGTLLAFLSITLPLLAVLL